MAKFSPGEIIPCEIVPGRNSPPPLYQSAFAPKFQFAYIRTFGFTGSVFTVQELMTGGNLGDCLEQKGHLPHEDVLQVLRTLLGAVNEIHKNDYVHRDLKLANLLLPAPFQVTSSCLSACVFCVCLGAERPIW